MPSLLVSSDDKRGYTSISAVGSRMRWRVPQQVIWCSLAHVFLILVHAILFVVMSNKWEWHSSIPPGMSASTLQTLLTLVTSSFGTVYTGLLLMLTQRLALRHIVLQPQTLTTLHDRAATWLGLGAAVNTVRKQRSFSGHVTLALLYLLLLFGLHNTIPALLNVQSLDHEHNTTAVIIQTTPVITSLNDNFQEFEIPYQNLPAMLSFSLPGLAGSMLYDTFSAHPNGNWTGPKPGMNATVCATTFRSTCEPKTALNISVAMDETDTVLYEIFFGDGWSARVDPAAGQIESKNHSGLVAVPMVRVIPAPSTSDNMSAAVPPLVPYVTLLATWNVTDASGTAHNTVHLTNVSVGTGYQDFDLTFLQCRLDWDVHSARIDSFNNRTMDSLTGSCARSDHMASNQTADPAHYNWTSIWTQTMSWLPGTASIWRENFSHIDVDSSVPERYLMSTLDWLVADSEWSGELDASGFQPPSSLPQMETLAQGLANMTATLFWLGATTNTAGVSWPSPYKIAALQTTSPPHVNISRVPLVGGLILSTLITALVIVSFWGRERSTVGIGDAGVLEIAWLVAHEQSDFQPMLSVNAPTDEDLRTVGRRIMWRGAGQEDLTSELRMLRPYVA